MLLEIKKNKEFPQYGEDEYGNQEIYYYIQENELNWLISQVEKKMELQEEIERLKALEIAYLTEINDLDAKNDELRDKLQKEKEKVEQLEKALEDIAENPNLWKRVVERVREWSD